MSNVSLHLLGWALVIGGLAWGAHRLGVDGTWIAIGAVVLAGVGVTSSVTHARRREPPPSES